VVIVHNELGLFFTLTFHFDKYPISRKKL
jgi:hypothetical protein